MSRNKNKKGTTVKMRLVYTDGHVEYRICPNRGRAEWQARQEGDKITQWTILE